jgi:hypothetical protein
MSRPGTDFVAEHAVSLAHEVLLADPEGMDAIADAVRKVQRNAEALL